MAKLAASDGQPGDGFGVWAFDGDRVVIGASGADGPGGVYDGAVYVFERDAGGPGGWGEVAKLTAAIACDEKATSCGRRLDNFFGQSAALSGDTIVAGNADFVYVFQRTPEGIWRRVARPIPADFGRNGYGESVALTGETALIGAYSDDDLGNQAGAVYVFEPDPGGVHPWAERGKLHAPDGEYGDYFGYSVSVSGATAVVGAPQIERDWRGEAHVLRRDAGGPGAWGAVAHLEAADGEPYDIFGHAVAISGDTVIVGAYGDDDRGNGAGAAYIFQARPAEALPADPEAAPAEVGRGSRGLAGTAVSRSADRAVPSTQVPWNDDELPMLDPPLPPRHPVLAPGGGDGATAGPWEGSGVSAPSEATLCFELRAEFIPYCDRLELTASGGAIEGEWLADGSCPGSVVAVSGTMQEGRVVLRCNALTDPCPEGFTYGWMIDLPLDGTMDMFQLDGLWQAWIDELVYTVSPGRCPF